jgi:cell division septation protein DedD
LLTPIGFIGQKVGDAGMKQVLAVAIGAAMAFGASAQTVRPPLQADVKAGVDAWGQGDYARAVAIWRPLAEAGDPDAQFNMGQASKLGQGVPADNAAALEYYRKAAAQGHARAEENYGLLLFQTGKRAEAMPYLKTAAERGEPRAQYLYGTALFNGEYVPRDWVRAYAMMVRSNAQGVGAAASSLSQMDVHIPAEQRQQGTAMAQDLERQQVAAKMAALQGPSSPPPAASIPVVTAIREPAPRPVRKTDVAEPKPAAAKPAPPKPASAVPKSGNWRVQLGAFSSEAGANALWKKLSGKGALAGYQPYVVKAGNIARLLAGPLASEADAEKLCRAVKAGGNDCITKKM